MNPKTIATPRLVAVAAGLTLAASALAAAPAGASSVYACAKAKGGTLRIVGRTARCHRGEHRLSLGSGPTGSQGPQGAQGKEGPQGKEGAAGKNGLNGAVAGYFASDLSAVPFTGAFEVTVVSKTIPAGNYIVWAKTALFSEAPAVIRAGAFCELRDDGNVLDTALWSQWLVSEGATDIAETTLPLQAALSTKATSTLSLVCSDTSADEHGQTIAAYYSQIEVVQTSQNA